MYVVSYRHTMANAKRIVNEAPPQRPRRQRLAEISLAYLAKQEAERKKAEREKAEALAAAKAKPLPVPLDLSWMIRRPSTAPQIIARVAAWHGMSASDILTEGRGSNAVSAVRMDAVAAVAVNCPHLTLTQLAKIFKRHHSTIISALRERGLR